MNRLIKFRGLDFDGVWQYGYLMQILAEGRTYSWIFNHGDQIAVDTSTIGQFTGLHDKNGVEIYEGDKLQEDLMNITLGKVGEIIHTIFWDESYCQFTTDTGLILVKTDVERFTITGNIHQNTTP